MPHFRADGVAKKMLFLEPLGDKSGREARIARRTLRVNNRKTVHLLMAVFITMQTDKKCGMIAIGDGHAMGQAHIFILVTGQEEMHAISFQQGGKIASDRKRNGFFIHPIGSVGARVTAAVSGINDNQHTSAGAGF